MAFPTSNITSHTFYVRGQGVDYDLTVEFKVTSDAYQGSLNAVIAEADVDLIVSGIQSAMTDIAVGDTLTFTYSHRWLESENL